ncbi:MAG: hypothetical protein R2698_04945 [Microthrixaceae bacterium]
MTSVELPSDVASLCASLAVPFDRKGRRLYLVGGTVRDLLVSGPTDSHDLDFTTDAPPEEVRALLAPLVDDLWLQGERFGTIAASWHGRTVEVTTHRREVYDPRSRQPKVTFDGDLDSDLSRRDFTVNAMAVELTGRAAYARHTYQLIDLFGGRDDLDRRVLRTPLEPAVAFGDDPLRMLRAVRFVASLGLRPAPELVDAISAMRDRMSVVSAERVRDELDRMLVVPDPAPGMALLFGTGLGADLLPEIATPPDLARVEPDLVLRWTAFLACASPEATRSRLVSLRQPRRVVSAVLQVRGLLDRIGSIDRWDAAAVRRLEAASDHELRVALGLAVGIGSITLRDRAAVEALVASMQGREDPFDRSLPVDGSTLIGRFGLEPGPIVGELLARLRAVRASDGPLTRDGALALCEEWLST